MPSMGGRVSGSERPSDRVVRGGGGKKSVGYVLVRRRPRVSNGGGGGAGVPTGERPYFGYPFERYSVQVSVREEDLSTLGTWWYGGRARTLNNAAVMTESLQWITSPG